MKRRIQPAMLSRRTQLSCLLLSLLLFLQNAAFACGPFFEQAIMVHSAHPDFPLSQYAQGNLGIVRPHFARSYLAVAYRYLQGKPLTASEQKSALALWDYRLLSTYSDQSNPLDTWRTARKAYTKAAGCSIDQFRTIDAADGSWQNYLNCPDDAFATAVKTLQERVAKYGQTSPIVKDWLQAQEQVFCHCAAPQFDFKTNKRGPEPPFPAAAPASADQLAKADRAYQIAAAHFYGQQYDQAMQEFQAIAQDSTSPWSIWAPYLVARVLVRKATTAPKLDMGFLTGADQRIDAIMANPALSATHEAAKKLRAFIEARLHPEKTLHKLAAQISDPAAGEHLQDYLTDYTTVYDNLLGLTSDDVGDLTYAKIPQSIKDDDLSDWIATFQSSDDAARQHAVEKYRANHSLAWLVAAVSKPNTSAANTESLTAAALALPANSAGFPTAVYGAARLMATSNPSAAKSALDKVLAHPNLPQSTRNLLLDERTKYATTLKQLVELSIRVPAIFSSDYEGNELPDDIATVAKMTAFPTGPKVLSPIGAQFFNMSATESQFVQTVDMKILPPEVQKDFNQATWTRAFVINDKTATDKLTPALKASFPAMSSLLNDFTKASPAERQFVGAELILHFPGMRPWVAWGHQRATPINQIDDYQENWWAAKPSEWASLQSSYNLDQNSKTPFPYPASILINNSAEIQKLKAAGNAPAFLGRTVISWATAHLKDPRVPEALSLVVKATRFGAKDTQTSKISKEAFEILHTRYPKSPWTVKTPYHY